jgi:hypothetical protein
LKTPSTPPVKGAVNRFIMKTILEDGYTLRSPNASKTWFNATSLQDNEFGATFGPKVAWASGNVFPFASLVFALVLFFQLGKRTSVEMDSEEGLQKGFVEIINAYSEKISMIRGIFDEFAKKGEVSRQDVDRAKVDIDRVRDRTLQRMNMAKTLVSSDSQDLQRIILDMTRANREYERATKDLLNTYEQYGSRRMKRATFERLLPSYEKRLNKTSQIITSLLDDLRKEQ